MRVRLGCCAISVVISQLAFASVVLADDYVSQLYRFTMRIPAGWTKQERDPSGGNKDSSLGTGIILILTERPQGSSGSFNPNMTIAVRDLARSPQTKSAQQIQDLAIDLLNSIPLGSSPGPVQPVSRNGFVGASRQLSYEQEYHGQVMKLAVLTTALGSAGHNRCFMITGAAPMESFAQYEPIFLKTTESFEALQP